MPDVKKAPPTQEERLKETPQQRKAREREELASSQRADQKVIDDKADKDRDKAGKA